MNKPIQWILFFSLTGWLFSLSFDVSAANRQTKGASNTRVHKNEWGQRSVMGILRKENNGYQLTILGKRRYVLYFSHEQVRRGEVIFMSPLNLKTSHATRVHAILKIKPNRPPQVVALERAPSKSHSSFSFHNMGAVINESCYKISDFIDGIVPSRPASTCRSC